MTGDGVFRMQGRRLGQEITLAPGGHVDVNLVFESDVPGQFEGVLHIESDDEVRPKVEVELAAGVTERGCPTAIIDATVPQRSNAAVADPEAVLRAVPLDDVVLNASASFDDHGAVEQFRWSLVVKPVDSQARLATNEGQLSGLWLDLAGTYVVDLEVENEEGASSCQPARLTIESVANEDIHLQLVWDTPDDPDQSDSSGSDIDLHFLNPQGRWNERPFDCFWQNMEPDWATPEASDNPSLDIDDVDGWGPENINLDNPEDGVNYGVGVHYFADHGYSVSFVTVRIYVDGVLRSEFLRRRMSDQNFWYVADLRWPTGDVEEIDTIHTSFPH
jgi:hypothetical protein